MVAEKVHHVITPDVVERFELFCRNNYVVAESSLACTLYGRHQFIQPCFFPCMYVGAGLYLYV